MYALNNYQDKSAFYKQLSDYQDKSAFYEQLSDDQAPLVSVVIPVYNAAKYLKRTIFSLLNQTYKKIELLCVDDGSTDDSLEILKAFQAEDPRVKVILKKNGGPASARNAALDAATGKYISFVDSDDELDGAAYEELVWKAESTDADIVVFGGKCVPEENTPEWITQRMNPKDRIFSDPAGIRYALFHEPSSRPFLWLHFLKREILEKPSPLRLNEALDLGEDQLFQFCYFPRAKKVVFFDAKLYTYYWNNEGSIMWKNNAMRITKFKKHLVLVNATLAYWQKNNIADPFNELISWMVNLLYWDLLSFPKYLQVNFSKEIGEIIAKYRTKESLYICGDISQQLKVIYELAAVDTDQKEMITKDIASLREQIDKVEKEIRTVLHSKTFRIGRLLTLPKNRISIKNVLPQERKKN